MQIAKGSPRFFRNNLTMAFFLMSLLLVTSAGCDAGATRDCSLDTYVVTTFEDVGDGVCGPEHCTLREAVQTVNSCNATSLTTIQLGEGTYELALRGAGDARGDLDISQNMAIVGISPARTSITAASDWNDRIIHVGVATTARIENLAIANGNSADGPGGGILNEGNLELDNVVLENNRAVYGAGLFNANEATLSSVEFFNNRAPGDQEIYLFVPDNFGFFASCGGGIANTGTLAITDGIVHENSAVFGSGICNGRDATLSFDTGFIERNEITVMGAEVRKGGGIYNLGTARLSSLMVRGNLADEGGGIYSANGEESLLLEGVFVMENEAGVYASGVALEDLGSGGGLYLSGGFQIRDSQIMDNLTHGLGGGLRIRNADGGLTNTSVGRNFAGGTVTPGRGGGIYVGVVSGGPDGSTLDLSNVTISSNQAGESGGAAYFLGGEATFINTTIANNNIGRTHSAANTGGIHLNGGSLVFQNSLLSYNRGECLISGGLVSSNGQNIEHNDNCGFSTPTDLVNIFPDQVILLDLVEMDGQWVHMLLPTGPAVDHIDPALCPEDDQTGKARPVGDLCDVGAYEMEAEVMSSDGVDVPLIPTPTAEAAEGDPAATALQNASCRKGADPAHEVHNFLYEGQAALVIGRMSEGTWSYVELPDELGRCWIFNENLELTGLVASLPLYTSAELPLPNEGGGDEGGDEGGGDEGGGDEGGGDEGGGDESGGSGDDGGGKQGGGGDGGGSDDTSAPDAPSNVSHQCTGGGSEFTISWNDNSDNEDGFRILIDGNQIGSNGPNVTQFVHDPGGSGPYTITIEAFNGNGIGKASQNNVGCFG